MKAKAKPDPMQAGPSCGVCHYWREETEGGADRWGLCRRYPPKAALVADDNGEDTLSELWPPTSVEDWCGEWKPSN